MPKITVELEAQDAKVLHDLLHHVDNEWSTRVSKELRSSLAGLKTEEFNRLFPGKNDATRSIHIEKTDDC